MIRFVATKLSFFKPFSKHIYKRKKKKKKEETDVDGLAGINGIMINCERFCCPFEHG